MALRCGKDLARQISLSSETSRVEVWLVPNPFVLFIDLSCVYYLSLETTHIIIILQRDPSPHDGDSVDIMLEFSLY